MAIDIRDHIHTFKIGTTSYAHSQIMQASHDQNLSLTGLITTLDVKFD